MKRPFAAVVLIYFAVLAFSVCLLPAVNLTLSITVTVLGIVTVFFCREKTGFFRIAALILIPIAAGFLVMWSQQSRFRQIDGALGTRTCVISGEVTEIPRRQYGRWYYVLRTDRIDIPDAPQQIRLRVTCRNSLDAKEGDRVTATVTFLRRDSDFGYDSAVALLADGIQARAWCSPYTEHEVTRGGSVWRYPHLTLRRELIAAIHRALPRKAAGMLCAMLLGDTDEMDVETVGHFRTAGLSHLLAVSGLHVSLLVASLDEFLQRLKRSFRFRCVSCGALVLVFMAVTGFSPSVTRAGIMHLMILAGKLLRRDTDALTSMAVGVLVMLLINPLCAADVGLQLSVAATFSLIVFSPRVREVLRRGWREIPCPPLKRLTVKTPRVRQYVLETLTSSLTASLATLPLCLLHFGQFSLIAPVANLLCLYAATLFLLVGIMAALLTLLPLIGFWIALPLRLGATLLCAYLDAVTGLAAKIPLAAINAHYAYLPLWVGCCIVIALAVWLVTLRNDAPHRRRHALCCLFAELSFLLLISMISYSLAETGGQIVVFAMQDGGVCVLAQNGSRAIIAEAGGDSYDVRAVEDALAQRGIERLDALTVSRKSDLRSANADTLIQSYAPRYCFLGDNPEQFPSERTAAKKQRCEILPFGGEIRIRGLTLGMYTDSAGHCWQRIQCGDTTVLVCPDGGDCAELPSEYLSCDVAVIGSPPQNITRLHTGAVIITSEFQTAAQTAYRLHVKGFRQIYFTQRDGTLTCAVRDGALHIRQQHRLSF